jgi:hypothetical protein
MGDLKLIGLGFLVSCPHDARPIKALPGFIYFKLYQYRKDSGPLIKRENRPFLKKLVIATVSPI